MGQRKEERCHGLERAAAAGGWTCMQGSTRGLGQRRGERRTAGPRDWLGLVIPCRELEKHHTP